MTTSNIFVRYFQTDDESNSVYISVADLEQSAPVDMDSDTLLYLFDQNTKTYITLGKFVTPVLDNMLTALDMDDNFGDDIDARHDAEETAYWEVKNLKNLFSD